MFEIDLAKRLRGDIRESKDFDFNRLLSRFGVEAGDGEERVFWPRVLGVATAKLAAHAVIGFCPEAA